ncbi:MAG: Stp1/IreP family PP2C-type Ser/Thr phosphatase [Acidobacteria bacterium]|nr:Stp1/IreP family PP2C-type Ser/Thr phosphatase [Acidobacteriota bacterium]
MRLEACGRSDIGKVRSRNEDSYAVLRDQHLLVVADGMGGHGNGDVASQIAVEAVQEKYLGTEGEAEGELAIAERLQRAFSHAHDRIRAAGDEDNSLRGMGTTMIAAVIEDKSAVIGHVGDSRAYALRGTTLTQLTEDHSWVHEQVAAGHLSADQARKHPFKSVVTRALGGEQPVEADLRRVRLQSGDLLILCSDGLTTMLTDDEIAAVLIEGGSIDEMSERLINAANEHGGADNTTVVLLAI